MPNRIAIPDIVLLRESLQPRPCPMASYGERTCQQLFEKWGETARWTEERPLQRHCAELEMDACPRGCGRQRQQVKQRQRASA